MPKSPSARTFPRSPGANQRGSELSAGPRAAGPPVAGWTSAQPLDIAGTLAGERILITGATGFLGKVLVEKLLWSVPEVGRLLLLVRAGGGASAGERLRDEVLASPIMARLRALHASDWGDFAASKVEVVAGDLGRDRFGQSDERYADLCRGVDRVVASAASVSFDERLDRALELNARGALRTLQLARDAGDVPLVHVSTCYVSGKQAGVISERLAAPDLDLERALAEAGDACRRLRDSEADDAPWVEAGAKLAERFGFHDVYTLSKALGERLLARDQGAVPLAIVRPAIVESAATEPIPGWIDAVRVTDPLLVAYGRGRTRDIPGAAGVPLELIPVDYVVNVLLAALADLERPGETGGRVADDIPIYQVGSSRNPITLGELMAYAREGFASSPLDESGRPVPEARFVEPERLRRKLIGRRRSARPGERRALDHFIRLIEVYRPYLSRGASYDDEATRGLWQRLSGAGREDFPFDVSSLDWRSYVAGVHVPGMARFALKIERGVAVEGSSKAAATHPARVAAGAKTLYELFAAAAERHSGVVAFQTCRDGRWLRYTYSQARTTIANVAHGLATRFRVERGDRVVLWSSGCPEWVLTTLALHRLGAIVVPLDPQWPVAEVCQAAELVGARLICSAPRLMGSFADDAVLERLGACPSNRGRAASSDGFGQDFEPQDRDPGALAAQDCRVVELVEPFVPAPDVGLLPGAEDLAAVDTAALSGDSEDVASILFTSGTTVAPKAVPLTHANYLANVRDLVPVMRLEGERLLSVLPIHHVFEQMVGLLVPIAGGSTISYVAEIKPAEINWMMNATRPTVLVAVPRLLELLHGGIMASVAAGGPALRRLFKMLFALSRLTGARYGHRLFAKVHRRFGGCLRRIATGGSALEPSLGRSFQLMGFNVAEGYGMTETSPVLTVNPWGAVRLGAAGKPLPGVETDLRPPADGTHIEEGAGEIWVRGANVMTGYYQNPEATAQVMDADGWLNTGDVGCFDSDGYLHISGRTKDVIVTAAGKNVYPEEVEARYRDLPQVEELIILGLPAEGGGERVCALVVPRSGASGDDLEQIRAALADRGQEVPSYQRPSAVEFWRGDLPKTTTMKVKRAVLRDGVLAGDRGSGEMVAPAAGEPARSEAESWILDLLARLTRTRPEVLRAGARLEELGVDSLSRVELVGAIEEHFGLRLDDAAAGELDRVRHLLALIPAD